MSDINYEIARDRLIDSLIQQLNEAKAENELLKNQLIAIGDRAVVDWDDKTVGLVDEAVKKAPATYIEWIKDLRASKEREKELNKKLETFYDSVLDVMDTVYYHLDLGDKATQEVFKSIYDDLSEAIKPLA